MISPTVVKIISHLPKGLVVFLSEKILNNYIKKYANIEVKGLENLKDIKRPILFICNHLSNSDALVINNVGLFISFKFSKPFTSLGMSMTKTISIKPNTADKGSISNIIKTLKHGNNILIFPEGTRSRSGSMIEGKKGVVLIQKLSRATIIPMSVAAFLYRLQTWEL